MESLGLKKDVATKSTALLAQLLANTYTIYLQTQNFHWNIEGENFIMFHQFLEMQYKQLAEAVDDIAERIRMLGRSAPAQFSEFVKLSTISGEGDPTSQLEVVSILLKNHENIISDIRSSIEILQKTNDEGTVDFFVERLRAHEEMAWMLRSHLQ